MFSKEELANYFLVALRVRLAVYKLAVNENKTAIINFTKVKETIFSFLGSPFSATKEKAGIKSTWL